MSDVGKEPDPALVARLLRYCTAPTEAEAVAHATRVASEIERCRSYWTNKRILDSYSADAVRKVR